MNINPSQNLSYSIKRHRPSICSLAFIRTGRAISPYGYLLQTILILSRHLGISYILSSTCEFFHLLHVALLSFGGAATLEIDDTRHAEATFRVHADEAPQVLSHVELTSSFDRYRRSLSVRGCFNARKTTATIW